MGERQRHPFLIVDDEPGLLESLRHLFRREYEVLTAPTAKEAIGILQRQDVHVILSDQRMPGTSGDEFLAQARTIQPDAVRLLFTGYADIQAVISAVNRGGIFRYILKPWDADDMQATIRQAAEQYDLLAERRRLITELSDANDHLLRANQELAISSQLKTAFLEVASHEFNTPITIVQGLCQILALTNPNRDPGEAELLRQVGQGTRQLGRLVANTLKMLEAGDFRAPLHREPTDVARLLRDAAAQVMPFATARGLRFEVEVPDDLGRPEVDPDKVRDAVLNVLSNAIKFTPDGGEFALRARLKTDDAIEIDVSDRGIGLERRELERLFDPFFTQFDPSRHSSGDFGFCKRGLGLGLSLVRKFVELHGGRVWAESELGQGTRITLTIPSGAVPGPTAR
jgi:signal transduction histidine kinase